MKATGNGSQNKGQYNTRTKHKLSYVSAKMYHIGTSNIEKFQEKIRIRTFKFRFYVKSLRFLITLPKLISRKSLKWYIMYCTSYATNPQKLCIFAVFTKYFSSESKILVFLHCATTDRRAMSSRIDFDMLVSTSLKVV